MKKAPAFSQNNIDYSALSPAQLLAVIVERDAQLDLANENINSANDKIVSANETIQLNQAAITARDKQLRNQQCLIKLLEEQLRLAQIRKFAASSEKLPFQVDLFDEAELEISLSDLEAQLAEADSQPPRSSQKKRNRGFNEALPRKRIELLLSEAEKSGALKTFLTKVKEELEFIPAQLNVLEYWQEKAVFKVENEERIISAPRPIHPLDKCFAHVSLLTHIIVAKYADGLPLYRLEGILKRYGHAVSRTNMANWVIRLDDVFKPMIQLIRETQNAGRYVNADETRIQVLKEDGRRAQSDKWMWITCGGPPDKPSVLFEYDPTRAGAVPERLLLDFTGTLQADGYSGYARL